MRKLLIIIIKFIPVVQLLSALLNNTLFYFELNNQFSYTLDFLTGNSFITIILVYLCSCVFNFCIWHRLVIITNFVNLCIANVDAVVTIRITDLQLLLTYYGIVGMLILSLTWIHIKANKQYAQQ